MAAEERPYPPSDQKLRKLREQGVVPQSDALNFLGTLVGLILSLFFILQVSIPALIQFAKEMFTAPISGPAALAGLLIRTVLAFVLPIVFCTFLANLVQNRFLFRPQLASFDLARLFQGMRTALRPGARLRAYCGGLIVATAWLCVGWMIWRGFSEVLVSLAQRTDVLPGGGDGSGGKLSERLAAEQEAVLGIIRKQLGGTLFVLAGAALLFGALQRFVSVLQFRSEHGMTRAEVEAENRELEVSPDLRRRISELQEDE